jgi:ABC-type glycerol-3-phosphate transport system substrate-binding protein
MSYFKIAILTIFSISIVAGVIVFAVSKSQNAIGSSKIIVWGTIPEEVFSGTYSKSSLSTNREVEVNYVKKSQADFDVDFVEALSEGRGPDVVILRDDLIYKNKNKLFVIPYKVYSERVFKDTFIEGGEIFLSDDGVVAIPFMVDPMVMYWNRDLFSSSGLSVPPKNWEEIYSYIDKLTKKDSSGNVLQSTVSFGEWRNVTNAKELISMLIMQAGSPITVRSGKEVDSVLNEQLGSPRVPAQAAVDFYTQFSNQTSSYYSWNRSLPNSLNSFLAGNLAMYFGFASELLPIQQKNSNLNFDVTAVPQIKDSKKKSVFGRMQALAIVKQSKNVSVDYAFINAMVEVASLTALEGLTTLPPVRRDMLTALPVDPFRVIFYNSALVSHSWIDPDPKSTSDIFRDMIENITSGKSRTTDSVAKASSQLDAQFKAR